ncbi:MAG: T9SS type A sorting domain-containing protein [Bacteroidales bacterium]|nr:T9SS type A sorting domain-containing protein [Bacteroidales bacterium]
MKRIIYILALLIITTFSMAQSVGWQQAERVTDTIHNHTNAAMFIPNDNSQDQYLLFWERQAVGEKMEICMKPYYSDEEPVVLLTGEGENYRNPQILNVENTYGVYNYIIAYESDKEGSWNIFAKLFRDGLFMGEVQITDTPEENRHMQISKPGVLCWENSGNIYSVELLFELLLWFDVGEVELIAEGNCANPVINTDPFSGQNLILAWEKHEDFGINIELRKTVASEIDWSDIELFYEGGNNTNLKFSKNNSWSDQNFLSWDHEVDGVYQIFYQTPDEYGYLSEVNAFQNTPFMPDLFPVQFIVKNNESTRDWPAGFLTYAYSVGESNIYSSGNAWEGFDHEYMINVSDSILQVRNSSFFEGKLWNDYFLIHNIWEAWQNDHWVLYSNTNYALLGSVKDTDEKEQSILLSPNPVTEDLSISFDNQNAEDYTIDVFDVSGRKRCSIQQQSQSLQEKHILNVQDQKLEKGIYFIKVQLGDRSMLNGKLIVK